MMEESSILDAVRRGRPVVFMDITMSGRAIGRLKMELFSDVAPKVAACVGAARVAVPTLPRARQTCENFRQLCTGEFR